ncbi:MAG: hypothetical protein QOI88_1858 [Gammaproteobacteria bacterium]|nr:hypothetical protein [Gammaproteobacteria bacterium]
MTFRQLDASRIVETLRRLEQRIAERFPTGGLVNVCRDLITIAGKTEERSRLIARPNLALRIGVAIAIIAGLAGLVIVAQSIHVEMGNSEIFSILQGVEAAANIVVLVGAALFFLVSLETRHKRSRSLRDLHTLRSIAHVIDMHQLTKDPSQYIAGAIETASSPERNMTAFELTRYLNYCSEMLSLTNKLAAVYAQHLPDAVVIEAVNDIETLTTNLSSKIWQKITIIDAAKVPR